MKTRSALGLFLLALTGAWAIDALLLQPASGAAWPWALRQQALYLTGVWSIGLMSLIMLLALRPAWLEGPLGGMDKIYRLHKWAGILAIGAGAAHWLIKLASTPLKALVGIEGRPARDAVLAMLADSRGLAKDLGEWTIYALLAMLVITLWRRFPYHAWRIVHRAMPLAFLVLAFHTLALAPTYYWTGPTGALLLPLMAGGAAAALLSLAGRIGQGRRVAGKVTGLVRRPGDILEVTCELGPRWPGHAAGQFAFVTFDRREGAHPFTIASAPHAGRHDVTFQIKALGDFTRRLAATLREGAPVTVEGPYGRFERPADPAAGPQVWVAGGIGVTPFLAWLEAARDAPGDRPPVWLHYCVRDAGADPFVEVLRQRCEALDNVTLQVHSAAQGQRLEAASLAQGEVAAGRVADVWYCGPAGLAAALRQGLRRLGRGGVHWHQEAFDMR
ncbi:ferredoxin reductase family protein [Achromobacter insuavis]|uniref:Oxidoreductase FAD-binding domain-containing protein 4 n=1 Tax=Achromobacter insuavis AXX-A TaxID=1003200 RepID=F7SW43_9BURK|nr:ferric reductase-like transmembrane domain-containing protein [Achromobacter insuavis]EGP47534.1 oxidoreductase FAD-binding domain-containing protein 4 [Achromobacter insuavis AXX-A]